MNFRLFFPFVFFLLMSTSCSQPKNFNDPILEDESPIKVIRSPYNKNAEKEAKLLSYLDSFKEYNRYETIPANYLYYYADKVDEKLLKLISKEASKVLDSKRKNELKYFLRAYQLEDSFYPEELEKQEFTFDKLFLALINENNYKKEAQSNSNFEEYLEVINQEKDDLLKFKIPSCLVLLCGYSNDEKIYNFLKKNRNNVDFKHEAINLALNRIAPSLEEKEIIKNNAIDVNVKGNPRDGSSFLKKIKEKEKVLLYLATPESIKEWSNILKVDYQMKYIPHSAGDLKFPIGYYHIYKIRYLIKNKDFREYLLESDRRNGRRIIEWDEGYHSKHSPKLYSKEDIEWIYNWIQKNYRDIEINDRISFGLPRQY